MNTCRGLQALSTAIQRVKVGQFSQLVSPTWFSEESADDGSALPLEEDLVNRANALLTLLDAVVENCVPDAILLARHGKGAVVKNSWDAFMKNLVMQFALCFAFGFGYHPSSGNTDSVILLQTNAGLGDNGQKAANRGERFLEYYFLHINNKLPASWEMGAADVREARCWGWLKRVVRNLKERGVFTDCKVNGEHYVKDKGALHGIFLPLVVALGSITREVIPRQLVTSNRLNVTKEEKTILLIMAEGGENAKEWVMY